LASTSPDTLHVARWTMIGPFPVGSREALVEPIWPIDPAKIVDPVAGDAIASMMVPGGWAHWTDLQAKDDTIAFAYKGTDWDALTNQWGAAGTASVGLAYGTLATPTIGAWIIDAPGIATLYIDGKRYL